MADVKWIKINTDMFDNKKIKYIRRLPDGNNMALIWVMLLTMAGRCNTNGLIFLTEDIPYTPQMLADELGFDESFVTLTLQTLEKLNMITDSDGFITVTGWEEHQNIEGMDKIREQTRARVEKYRQKQKNSPCSVTSNATVTESNATDKEIDIERELEIDKKYNITPIRHKHGEYGNVLLSDEDFEKLKTEFPADYKERIEQLSSYMASTGKKYKNHLATIRNWARKETITNSSPQQSESNGYNAFMAELAAMRE